MLYHQYEFRIAHLQAILIGGLSLGLLIVKSGDSLESFTDLWIIGISFVAVSALS